MASVDAVVLTIGTPIDEHLNPAMKDGLEVVNSLAPHLHNGQVVVLRSRRALALTVATQ